MSPWRTLAMRDLMVEFHDGPHATPPPADDGPVYLGIKNITDQGALDLRDIRHIDESDFANWTRRVTPQPGDVVFTYEATLHRYALIPEGFRGCLGRRIALIRPDRSVVLPRFLHLLMLGPGWRETINSRVISGSTVDRIPIIDFPDFPIEVPDLATQRAVVEVLGAIDDLIENNRRRVEVLEEMAKAIYREWFVHFRYPGHGDAIFVDSPLGSIPEGWTVRRTGQLIADGTLEIGDGYRAKNAEMTSGEPGLPFVRVANVGDGVLLLEGADQLPLDYIDRLRSKVSQPGDTVVSMKGTVGRTAFVHDLYPRLAYSPQVSYWRSLDHEVLPPEYVYCWIRSEAFGRQCAAVKGSTDMADYVNLGDQRRMDLLLPPPSVVSLLAATVEPMFRTAALLRVGVGLLAGLRSELLPKLVTGQIDLSSLDLDRAAEASVA